MQIDYVNPYELIPADYNPREISEKEFNDLKDSITKFGFKEPVLVNQHSGRRNIIIGGHMRVRAAQALGMDTVPVHYMDLDEKQERELNIRLNKNTGRWDIDLLTSHFGNEELKEFGFSDWELEHALETAPEYLDEEKETQESIKFTIKFDNIAELELFKKDFGFEKNQMDYREFKKRCYS